jgi:transposase
MKTKYCIHLSEEERQELEALIRNGQLSERAQIRARILMLCDEYQKKKKTTKEITSTLQCCLPTITNIRKRFLKGGLGNALYDKLRSGAPQKITVEIEAQLTLLTCSAPPNGKARWTSQMLADKLVELKLVESISNAVVMKWLKKRRDSA